MADMSQRTVSLIGEDAFEELQRASIIVFGVGGVGGNCIEALARAGIGKLTLVDFDVVDETNINRQIIALQSTVGRYKVDVMRERLLDITPDIDVTIIKEKVTKIDIVKFCITSYDYVIDAIDDVKAKVAIIEEAETNSVPIISSMGMGNKLDPSKLKITTIGKTNTCPLARKVRRELGIKGITTTKVVYSEEVPTHPGAGSNAPSSISYMPASAGLLIASVVIGEMIKSEV